MLVLDICDVHNDAITRPDCTLSKVGTLTLQSLLGYYMYRQVRHQTRQAGYIKFTMEPRSRNHCCHAIARRITYPECVFVALIIQHVKRVRHIVICSLSDTIICFHIIP